MKRFGTAAMALMATAVAFSQSSEILYTPVKVLKDQSIKVRAWGSGTASETDELAYEGGHSIRISSRNYFQGGSLTFDKPISLANSFASKANLLRIILRTADQGTTLGFGGPGAGGAGAGRPGGKDGGGPGGFGGVGGGGVGGARGGQGGPGGLPGGFPGGFPGGGPGGRGGQGGPGGFPGGFPGGGVGGARGGQGGPGGQPGGFPGGFPGGGPGGRGGFPGGAGASAVPVFKTLRVIVTTTDGKKSEAYLPVSSSSAGENGWKNIGLPLQAITGLDRTNKVIKEIAFSGDATATFYVGELRVVSDTTPIRADILGNRTYNLALGDQLILNGSGTGGASILKYSWDFDNTDGIQADAENQQVVYRFRKPGKFKVTLTVTDSFGLKAPATATIEVTVNP